MGVGRCFPRTTASCTHFQPAELRAEARVGICLMNLPSFRGLGLAAAELQHGEGNQAGNPGQSEPAI